MRNGDKSELYITLESTLDEIVAHRDYLEFHLSGHTNSFKYVHPEKPSLSRGDFVRVHIFTGQPIGLRYQLEESIELYEKQDPLKDQSVNVDCIEKLGEKNQSIVAYGEIQEGSVLISEP